MNNPIKYSQCWEDTNVVLQALKIKPTSVVLSITSGGDNTIALAQCLPRKIYAVDVNPAQNHLLELKLAALQKLNKKQCLSFLGITNYFNRLQLFEKLTPALSEEAKMFWKENKALVVAGIIHAGKLERYFQVFRKYILPLVHSQQKVDILLQEKSLSEQHDFYQKKWNNLRWCLLFKLFFSKTIMKRMGRQKAMFAHAKIAHPGNHYLQKTAVAMQGEVAQNNPYLEYILKGNFIQHFPEYLKPNSKEITIPQIYTLDLLRFMKTLPNNHVHAFNLSDVFEPLSKLETHEIFTEIVRVAKTNARVIFWNNLVLRDVPKSLKPIFKKEVKLEQHLRKVEKVFFYNRLCIYSINK